MLVCRAMSLEELLLYLNNIEIVPQKNMALRSHGMTDCKREICFFGMENEAFANYWNEVVVVFDIPEENLRKGYGIYDWTYGGRFIKTEYRMTSYSKESAKYLYWYYADDEVYDSETDRIRTDTFGPYFYKCDISERCYRSSEAD